MTTIPSENTLTSSLKIKVLIVFTFYLTISTKRKKLLLVPFFSIFIIKTVSGWYQDHPLVLSHQKYQSYQSFPLKLKIQIYI